LWYLRGDCARLLRPAFLGDETKREISEVFEKATMSLGDGRKMKTTKIYFVTTLALVLMFVVSAHSKTVATFADPALNTSTPLFTIDGIGNTVNGGWGDNKTGLNFEVVWTGNTYNNAYFTMTQLTITSKPITVPNATLAYFTTSGGTIKFFKDNDPTSAMPILQIDFDSLSCTFGGLGGDNVFSGNNVKFSGFEIGNTVLSEETFAFSFANLRAFNSVLPDNGYTSTASFTSSAVPEPVTLALLGIGGMALLRRRSHRNMVVNM
jgi:hypothetical protein